MMGFLLSTKQPELVFFKRNDNQTTEHVKVCLHSLEFSVTLNASQHIYILSFLCHVSFKSLICLVLLHVCTPAQLISSHLLDL